MKKGTLTILFKDGREHSGKITEDVGYGVVNSFFKSADAAVFEWVSFSNGDQISYDSESVAAVSFVHETPDEREQSASS